MKCFGSFSAFECKKVESWLGELCKGFWKKY